jgi:hypothetical protein
MPFALEGLSVVSYADGFTLWHYRAGADSRATVGAAGYFTPAGHMLRAGDMMVANAADGLVLMTVSGTGASLRATAF